MVTFDDVRPLVSVKIETLVAASQHVAPTCTKNGYRLARLKAGFFDDGTARSAAGLYRLDEQLRGLCRRVA